MEEASFDGGSGWTMVIRCPHGKYFPLPLELALNHAGHEHHLTLGCGCADDDEVPARTLSRKEQRKVKRWLRSVKADDFQPPE